MHVAFEDYDFLDEAHSFELFPNKKLFSREPHARENYMKKNSCTPINPKKYSCYGQKKIHTRNLITKKNS